MFLTSSSEHTFLVMGNRTLHYCYVVVGVMLVLTGGLFYILCRPSTILINHIISAMGLDSLLEVPRDWMRLHLMSSPWVYSLPAGLWSASYVTLSHAYTSRFSQAERFAYASVIPLLGVVSELLQGVGAIPGTFDPIDLVCYVTPYLMYLILMCCFRKENLR